METIEQDNHTTNLQKINDTFVNIIIAVPAIIMAFVFLEEIIGAEFPEFFYECLALVPFILSIFDSQRLKIAGVMNRPSIFWNLCPFLSPVYIYKRCKRLNRSLTPFYVFIAIICGGLLILGYSDAIGSGDF